MTPELDNFAFDTNIVQSEADGRLSFMRIYAQNKSNSTDKSSDITMDVDFVLTNSAKHQNNYANYKGQYKAAGHLFQSPPNGTAQINRGTLVDGTVARRGLQIPDTTTSFLDSTVSFCIARNFHDSRCSFKGVVNYRKSHSLRGA
eukprot:COSAG01_NODE_37118_length_508_cov_0.831296_1_plen_144_part_10